MLIFARIIFTTTNTVEGPKIATYHGIVPGETIIKANLFHDFLADIRDVIGGRARSYERIFSQAKKNAINELLD